MSLSSPSCCSPPTHSPPISVSRLSRSRFYYRLSISASASLCVYERGYIESVWLVDTEEKEGARVHDEAGEEKERQMEWMTCRARKELDNALKPAITHLLLKTVNVK